MIEDLEIQNMMMTTSKYECVQYKWTVTIKTTYINDGTKKNYFQNYSIDVDDNLKRKNFIYL